MKKSVRLLISITIATFCLLVILCSCGNATDDITRARKSDEIRFRDIPFGTKLGEAVSKLKEDLEKQGFNGDVLTSDFGVSVLVVCNGIKLYDYDDVSLSMNFIKTEIEDVNDAIFISGHYTIDTFPSPEEENAKKCYYYFNDKLTEIYGDKTQLWEETTNDGDKKVDQDESPYAAWYNYDNKWTETSNEGWKKGDTICYIEGRNHSVIIYYELDDLDAFTDAFFNGDRVEKEQAANSGL